MNGKPHPLVKDIGARFRSARSLVPNLNRKSFCERHGINRYTMQSWENGLHVSKGINVEKFINALAKEGVYCTAEWLFDGKGEGARPINTSTVQEDHNLTLKEEHEMAIKKILAIYECEERPVLKFKVKDRLMAPKFLPGDIVLGQMITDPKEAHQKICIVDLGKGSKLIRKVIVDKNSFFLLSIDDCEPMLTISASFKLYKVVWHLLS